MDCLKKPRFLVLMVLAAALALPAGAAADLEPNNAIWQAETPGPGGATFSGSLPTGDIADWYAFYVAGQQQVHMSWTTSLDDEDDNCAIVGLVDSKGEPQKEDFTTAAGTNPLYVRAYASRQSSCPDYDYSFSLLPAAPITLGPASLPPTPTGEPNESKGEALGPLVGGTLYRGSIDTSNDHDDFFFVTAPGRHQVTITAYVGVAPTSYPFDFWGNGIESPDCSYYGEPNLYATGPEVAPESDSTRLTPSNEYGDEGGSSVESTSFTASGSHRYDIEETASEYAPPCNEWLFRVDPPSALATPQSLFCAAASEKLNRYKHLVRSTHRRLARARRRSAKHRLKRLLKRQKRSLAQAKAALTASCP